MHQQEGVGAPVLVCGSVESTWPHPSRAQNVFTGPIAARATVVFTECRRQGPEGVKTECYESNT